MTSTERTGEATVRLLDWSEAEALDLDGTAERLNDGARARFESGSPADARRFLIGRALLVRTVAELLGVAEPRVRVAARCPDCGLEHGRTTVDVGGRPVYASLSHTTGASAVAVSAEVPVGVDVERLDAERFAGIETVALSPAELSRWRRAPAPDRLRDLAEHWTMKEAVLKALGTGLTTDPATIDLPEAVPPHGVATIAGRPFVLRRPDLGPDLVCATALLTP